MLRVGSLFSGIGGVELGLERAGGFETCWFVEKEPYAQGVLRKHWPHATLYSDITKTDFRYVAPVDVLSGGFPCQDISSAGKRKGIQVGTRSGLWFEFARAIGTLRPRYVVVENVAAILDGELGTVLGDLAALGYAAEWHCIPAAAVGAPHRRDRIFLIAYADGERQHHVHGREAARDVQGDGERDVQAAPREGLQFEPRLESAREGPGPVHAWAVEPGVGRVADGVPYRAHRLKCLGNAVVPQVAEAIGRAILAREALK